MVRSTSTMRGFLAAAFVGVVAACAQETSVPTSASPDETLATASGSGSGSGSGGSSGGNSRVRCERRSGPNRSKISVDGNNLVPLNGTFRARVSASGGTVTAPARRAVGDEVEFDFDSNPNDIAQGATPISATFITARAGADVIGEILNAQGQVVFSQGVECQFR